MPNYFAIARAFLASIDPAAPAAALILTVFFAVYATRRWFPRVWLWLEKMLPFVDSLDYRPIATIVSKFVQSLPGALLGVVVASLSSGASVKTAVFGVLAGFGASLTHEIMASYKGQVSAPKPLSNPMGPMGGMLALCLCFSLVGCGLLAAAAPYLAEAGVLISDAGNAVSAVEASHLVDAGLIARARAALAAAAAADNGVQDLTAEQLDASLAAFRAAWGDIQKAYGAKHIGAAEGGAAALPVPLAMRRTYK